MYPFGITGSLLPSLYIIVFPIFPILTSYYKTVGSTTATYFAIKHTHI